MKFKSCCCCIRLEHGIYLIGGVDTFFFIVGIISMIYLIMEREQAEMRNRSTNHRPEEFPEGFLSPFIFELPRLLAFFYLACRPEDKNNLKARRIYYVVQFFSLIVHTLIAILTIWITLAYVP